MRISRDFTQFAKFLVPLFLIICTISLIIIIWISATKGWAMWCQPNDMFNIFGIMGLISGALGFLIYKSTPAIGKQLESVIEQIPKKWDAIMDSGSTKYFNPVFYTIAYGKYNRSINSSIEFNGKRDFPKTEVVKSTNHLLFLLW